MKRYPLMLKGVSKSAIWGGNILKEEWNKKCDGENIAESWELTVREKENSVIANGEAAGKTLAEYIKLVGADAVSSAYCDDDGFPLLVKFIDAADRLSVQVHPDDDYAARDGESGKTEMWYIVDAEDDAEIIYGLADGVDGKEFCRMLECGRLNDAMKRVKVKQGDSFFIPAGMLHAIGKGILIAEIQQNSDLTYRVYDYDRVGKDGKKRELHTEKAKDVVRSFTEEEVEEIRFFRGKSEEYLANGKYFNVRRICVSEGESEKISGSDSFASLLCIGGEGKIEFDGESYPIAKGDSYYLPAKMGDCVLSGDLTLLCSRV